MGQRLLCSDCFRVADGLDRVQTSSGTKKRNDVMVYWVLLRYNTLTLLGRQLTDSVRVFASLIFSQLQNSGETCVQSDLQGKSLLWNGDAVQDSMEKTAERVRELIFC